jgi:hypothetical protein
MSFNFDMRYRSHICLSISCDSLPYISVEAVYESSRNFGGVSSMAGSFFSANHERPQLRKLGRTARHSSPQSSGWLRSPRQSPEQSERSHHRGNLRIPVRHPCSPALTLLWDRVYCRSHQSRPGGPPQMPRHRIRR